LNRVSRQCPAIKAGIVHLGLGAFSRAHLSIYTADAIENSGGDWGIVGVSLRSAAVRDALSAQQFTYTAAELSPEKTTYRQIEVISDVLLAFENPALVVEKMADPAIKIVSLTITEKGYCLAPTTNALNLNHPDIEHDIAHSLPVSAAGFLVRALQARMRASQRPFTVLSCDNLPDNGNIIRRAVLALAEQIDTHLMQWIKEYGCFPSTMVDRITPASTEKDRQDIEFITGFSDACPVVHEPFSQWVIEDNFVQGERPDWHNVGVEIVPDVRPYELMKLRMLNGTHTALAYLGYLAGFKTIADTVADSDYKAFIEILLHKEIIPCLSAPPGVSLPDYAQTLLTRYANPRVRHLTGQIAMDGSQKLPQRILGIVDERHAIGAASPGLVLVIAAWMRYIGGVDERGATIELHDPLADKFAELAKYTTGPDVWIADILAMREVFPKLTAQILTEPLTKTYMELLEHGAHRMVRKFVREYHQ